MNEILKEFPDLAGQFSLTKGQRVEVCARMETVDAIWLVLSLFSKEEGGQILLRGSADDHAGMLALHADTLVFPLPREIASEVPDSVEAELTRQTAAYLQPDLGDAEQDAYGAYLHTGQAPITAYGVGEWFRKIFPAPRRRARRVARKPKDPVAELNERLHRVAVDSIGQSSKEGPKGGKLACVWMVRRLFAEEFRCSLTGTDSTARLAGELARGKGRSVLEKDVRPGNLVISPTEGPGRVGHVGIVGEDGLIYSNSSNDAEWSQNYTVARWKSYYGKKKGLEVRFYQILPAVAGLERPVAAEPPITTLGAAAPVVSEQAIARLAEIEDYWAASRMAVSAFEARVPLVAEGDSWFDFKILPDVIDWLERKYPYKIHNAAQAGATVYEMAYGPDTDQPVADFFGRDPSQLAEVVRLIQEKRPRALLLSGTGNDLVGPEFILLIRHALSGAPGLNEKVVDAVLRGEIEPALDMMIQTMTEAGRRSGLGELPVLIHGYDYPFPDGRKVKIAFGLVSVGPWMHDSFLKKGYPLKTSGDLAARAAQVRRMIDMLYDMLERLRRRNPNLHVVNLRGVLPKRSDWHDELHPTRKGFERVADEFEKKLRELGV